MPPPPAAARFPREVILLGLLASVAALVLHAYPVIHPWLFDDDFAILAQSWTWSETCRNLWKPWNEHAMPLGRLSTWVLVEIAGRPTALPQVAALQGPLAVVLGMWLVYFFVAREMRHPFYGLAAMILFGITLKFNEAVVWFAASFAVLALDTTLLGLLAAQRWRETGRRRHLAFSALWAVLAPGWFASGVLAGPFCCLYLLLSGKVREQPTAGNAEDGASQRRPGRVPFRRLGASAIPLLGTATFLAISLPQTAGHIQHAAHYGGRTATQAFAPVVGLELTGRTIVDNLVFGVNASGRTCPLVVVPVLLAFLAAAGWWWWSRPASRRGLMMLGLAFIVVSYWLIYSFRAGWPYEGLMGGWTRYNLMPWLGLVFFLCGGLPNRQGTLFRLDVSGRLTWGQVRGLTVLTGVLFALQFSLGVAGHKRVDRDPAPQMAALRRIEEVDARCRAYRISAATAGLALDPLDIPHSGDPPQVNGWVYLRGSDDPVDVSPAEARRLIDR